MNFTIRCFLLVLLSTGLGALQPTLEKYGVKTSNFSPQHLNDLEKTFAYIEAIQPKKLRIPIATYLHYSKFKKMFGFRLQGKKLARWVADRIDKVIYYNGDTVAANQGNSNLLVGDDFFKSPLIEKIYMIIHEARHSDGPQFGHSDCTEFFPFVSIGQPEAILAGAKGCDDREDGAYAFQAALLYEFFAYGLVDAEKAGALYNSSIVRILPHYKKVTSQKYRAFKPTIKDSYEYNQRKKIVSRLNGFESFYFEKMWETKAADAFHSSKNGVPYTVLIYRDRKAAMKSYKEKMKDGSPVFVIGAIVGVCPMGDRFGMFSKLRNILIGLGMQLK